MSPRFTLFDTPIGTCALVWAECGLIGTSLPEPGAAATRSRVRRRFHGAVESEPPPPAGRVIERVLALLHGEPDDLADIALDLRGLPDFNCRVCAVARFGASPGLFDA